MRNHQNVKAALVGETFDERFVLFGPVLLGCLFSALVLLSFSSPLRSVIIAIGVSFAVVQFVNEIALRLDEALGFPEPRH